MRSILSILSLALFCLFTFGQESLPGFYKDRIPKNKTFYVGLKWTDNIAHSKENPKYQISGWSFYRINSSDLELYWNNGWVEQIYLPVEHAKLLNDSSRVAVGVDKIHSAIEPIPVSFEGKDVIYGYVDSGLDYNHADFLNPDSTTRVLYYWNQGGTVDGTTPTKYGYGNTCDSAAINAGTCNLNDSQTHGTTVVGSGSGNGLATGIHKGMAPKTDIIMVQTDFTLPNWDLTVADAIDYIFSIADTLGKPCVINTSVGNYLGSHDGLDPAGHIVDSLLNDKDGRIVIAAAGNSGHLGNYHLKHISNPNDTSFFWVDYNGSSAFGNGAVYFDLWSDTIDFKNLYFSISADKHINGFERRAESPFRTISDVFPGVFRDTLYGPGGDTIAKYEIHTLEVNGMYHFEFYIEEPDSNEYYFGFNVTGNGLFDVWTGQWMGLSNIIHDSLHPSPTDFPLITNYIHPDSLSTVVSSWSCLESTITVANWTHQNSYIDYFGDLQVLPVAQGYLSGSSSRGPNRKGIIKPEISSPGDVSMSAVSESWRNSTIAGGGETNLAPGGWHVRNGGTSMAAPVVGGVAALYLERCNLGNWQDFKSKLIASAVSDSYTGNTPNFEWGYGKLDGYGLLSLSGPNLVISGDTGICDGNPALLTLNQFYDTIYWNTGATSLSTQVFSEQYIYAYAADQLGCWDRTDSIFIREGITPLVPTINELGGGLISTGNDFYQWYFEGSLIEDETGQFITPQQNGNYTVQVMDSAGCSIFSDPFLVGNAGLDDLKDNAFSLYPNPTNKTITITHLTEIYSVKIMTIDGREVFNKEFEDQMISIDLSEYENGAYLVFINDTEAVRVIKQ